MKDILITVFFLLLGLGNLQAQDQQLFINARPVGGEVIVRWTPGDYDTWRRGVEMGYMVYAEQLDDSGNLLNVFPLGESILPTPEGQWPGIGTDEYLGLGHALLYDFSQSVYEGPQGAFTQREDRINRYNFMLFTADISIDAASHMGLAARHIAPEPTAKYRYKVYLRDTTANIQSAYAEVDMNNVPPLPIPDSMHIRFHDQYFDLAWEKADLLSYYTSYDIEYSTDGGQSFELLNEKPFVFFEDETVSEAVNEFIFYRDSIENYVDYQFRIRGRSPFGEFGPYSEIVSGQGRPSPFLMLPRITELTEMADESFKLTWNVNETYIDSVIGYNVLRYEYFPGESVQLNTTLLTSSDSTFTDENPLPVNFYQIEVIDVNDNHYLSPTALGQLRDSIPPAAPLNLLGIVDTILDSVFVVKLTWDGNQEADHSSYKVFQGNGLNLEFSSLTNSALRDTIYYDTLPVATLAEETFYKVQAIDFTGNLSAFSAAAQVERPDLIPPVPPVLNRTAVKSTTGIGLHWINSSSKDVVSYDVERKIAYSDDEWVVLESRQKNNRANDELLDNELNDAIIDEYWYRVKVTDDAGLYAYSDTLTVKPALNKKRMPVDLSFGLRNTREEKSILLYWQADYPPEAEKVIILRNTDNGNLYTLAQIPINTLEDQEVERQTVHTYRDFFVEEDRSYLYKIQLQYANGERSNLSQKTARQF